IRAPPAKCPRPRVSLEADRSRNPFRQEEAMPVYTVHAPSASGADVRAADGFIFVRDGFHLWAAILGVVWLAWHRLWIAMIGWVGAVGADRRAQWGAPPR